MKRTANNYERTVRSLEPTADMARPEKVQHSYKGSSSVASVAIA
jgi:hypothetical protein